MRIDRVPLHARSLGDTADSGPRGPQLGVQINRRFDDTAAGFRLVFRPSLECIAAFPNHFKPLYPHIDAAQ